MALTAFYSSATANEQAEAVQTSLLALAHQKSFLGGDWSTRLSWRRGQDEYVFLRRNPSVYRNLHLSHTLGLDSYYSRENSLGQLGLGVDIQSLHLSSNLLGQRERLSVNLLVEHAFRWADGRIEVTPGLTLNYLSDGDLTPLPGLDVLWRLTQRLKLYANVGSTFRVPSYTELYYRDRFNIGDPNLEPERAIALELGLGYTGDVLELRGSVWRRDGKNLIDYALDSPTDTVWQARNVNSTRFQGVELAATARQLTPWLPLVSASYNYIDAELDMLDGDMSSRYVLDQLQHQAIVRATVAVGRFSLTPALRLARRERTPATQDLPVDYTLLDARIDYRTPRWTLYVDGNNINDQEYVQTNGVPLPGIWMRGGLVVRL